MWYVELLMFFISYIFIALICTCGSHTRFHSGHNFSGSKWATQFAHSAGRVIEKYARLLSTMLIDWRFNDHITVTSFEKYCARLMWKRSLRHNKISIEKREIFSYLMVANFIRRLFELRFCVHHFVGVSSDRWSTASDYWTQS